MKKRMKRKTSFSRVSRRDRFPSVRSARDVGIKTPGFYRLEVSLADGRVHKVIGSVGHTLDRIYLRGFKGASTWQPVWGMPVVGEKLECVVHSVEKI